MIAGISYIAKGFNKGNNKYMQSFDDKKLSKYIMHLDANNLWGWTITQYLACGGFKWLDKKKLIIFNMISIGENISIRHILEVDLVYPNKLH